MAEEPRRSGRATKGQHKNASSSPAPQPKPAKQPQSRTKAAASKKQADGQQQDEADYDTEEEKIRCICGDDNAKDKRAFIGCEACEVWQHNICMGMPEDEDEVPEHYFCEECQPEEHRETLEAIARGEKVWETRNRIYANEKKAGSKRKGKSGKGAGGWLKKDVHFQDEEVVENQEQVEATGTKRKRGEEPDSSILPEDVKSEVEENSVRASTRQDKRRKSTVDDTPAAAATEEEAVEEIDKLPSDRQKIATALSKILLEDFNGPSYSSRSIPDDETPQSLADRHALQIELALKLSHEGPGNPAYMAQFRALNANLKKNKVLIARLLDASLTPAELSTMNSKDMASEELQKERAVMKEQLDRQAVAVQVAEEESRPRLRRTHKGDEEIEDVGFWVKEGGAGDVQPVRERTSVQEGNGAASPTTELAEPLRSASRDGAPTGLEQRRQSSQTFDMKNIWAKTAGQGGSPTSPTAGGGAARLMQLPPKRRSSVKNTQSQQDGSGGAGAAGATKEDADIDRMLQDDPEDDEDNDDTYSPPAYTSSDPSAIVWRGKLIQSADSVSPTCVARFVAGRDLSSTVAWHALLPSHLGIDGRLQIAKAEEYLCSLQWSQSTDVSVLSLTPYNDAEAEPFELVWSYFKSRERYAVVNRDKPNMVKDLYVIPLDVGQEVPSHVGMLEFNRLGGVVGEKCLLASLVVSRGSPATPGQQGQGEGVGGESGANGNGNGNGGAVLHRLPQHMRNPSATASGPAGSPLNTTTGTFSPPSTTNPNPNPASLPPPGAQPLPPNPYSGNAAYTFPLTGTAPPGPPGPPAPPPFQHHNPLIDEVLGNLQYAPTAQMVIHADPAIQREKLEHLKFILEDDPRARTEMEVIARRLFQ